MPFLARDHYESTSLLPSVKINLARNRKVFSDVNISLTTQRFNVEWSKRYFASLVQICYKTSFDINDLYLVTLLRPVLFDSYMAISACFISDVTFLVLS